MTTLVSIENLSGAELDLLHQQIMVKKTSFLEKEVTLLREENAKINATLEIKSQEMDVMKHRLDNFDLVNVDGDPQQRLNAMVRKYAAERGITFSGAWREFRQAYDVAYRTTLTSLVNNYKERHGLKSLTVPQYLSMSEKIEDAVRVADKMLNKRTSLRAVN